MTKEEEKKIEMQNVIKNYAFYKSKKRRLIEYKKILMVTLMKEISAQSETSIKEQENQAKKHQEYKNLLYQIKEYSIIESKFGWQLDRYVADCNDAAFSSSIERTNNWNIHNL